VRVFVLKDDRRTSEDHFERIWQLPNLEVVSVYQLCLSEGIRPVSPKTAWSGVKRGFLMQGMDLPAKAGNSRFTIASAWV
jgi:hypothetical protein